MRPKEEYELQADLYPSKVNVLNLKGNNTPRVHAFQVLEYSVYIAGQKVKTVKHEVRRTI